MALQIHCPSSFTTKPYRLPLHSSTKTHFRIKSQNQLDPSESTIKVTETTVQPKKSTSQGLGFGSSASSPTKENAAQLSTTTATNKKRKSKRERASIIRRSPVEKPAFGSVEDDDEKAKETGRNESAFLLTWLGLGVIILTQGIILSASGFLPEEWDKFLVKYLYPTFTPTVGLFIAGTVTYGVLKYLQNENLKDQK
ncbi:hypothetical protein CsatB_009167 [Cannabis sativa]|uniref:Protein LOW PSII ACCUMULATION 2, chloroplastic n=1 Tax=Cannabis sativa TaxID=3483 RepID=A0A7J6FNC4_CANSA|nr:protein LPA2 [Cannabis sativa]KAF4372138.1 hypothetical protein F8388_000354 [Cannabis sativa]